jgi:hypothetical protein
MAGDEPYHLRKLFDAQRLQKTHNDLPALFEAGVQAHWKIKQGWMWSSSMDSQELKSGEEGSRTRKE